MFDDIFCGPCCNTHICGSKSNYLGENCIILRKRWKLYYIFKLHIVNFFINTYRFICIIFDTFESFSNLLWVGLKPLNFVLLYYINLVFFLLLNWYRKLLIYFFADCSV